jgi:hypothetical protein
MKRNSEVGMRKWEIIECGSRNAEVGMVRNSEVGNRKSEVGMRKWEL